MTRRAEIALAAADRPDLVAIRRRAAKALGPYAVTIERGRPRLGQIARDVLMIDVPNLLHAYETALAELDRLATVTPTPRTSRAVPVRR